MSTDTAWRVVHVLMGLGFAGMVVRANPGPTGWLVVAGVGAALLAAWGVSVLRRRTAPGGSGPEEP